MKKEFEKEQKDNQIDDAFLDMPNMDDDEKFSQWLEDEYLKEADAIEESLFAGRKFEDNQDIAEKLSVSRESFYQRMREEGMLDEETTEDSDETAEISENKILEFKKDPETSKETADSVEKVVSIEKKSSAKKKHSYVRFGRIAGIAGLCLICVFAASMSSEANRNYFIKSVRYLAGDDARVVIGNDEENENIKMDEYEAMADIEEKLGVKLPEFYYRPYEMKFIKYEVSEMADFANIEYQYKNTILSFHINKQNNYAASNVSSTIGEETEYEINTEDDLRVCIKEVKDKGDIMPTYIATWTDEKVTYYLSGKIELEEIKKIIKYMKF